MEKSRNDKQVNAQNLFLEAPQDQISRILQDSEELIKTALEEGRLERDAAAAAIQPSPTRGLRVFFK